MKYDSIKVGLGLVLIKDGQVLLAKRKSASNGLNEYGGPGGELHPGESLKQSILRELAEECGPDVTVQNLRQLCVINYRNPQGPIHWVGIGFCAEYVGGAIQQLEPHKHGDWQWHDLERLPSPLYWPIAQYIAAYKTGQNMFEL